MTKKKLLASIAGLLVTTGIVIGVLLVFRFVLQSAPLETVMSEQYGNRMIDFELSDMNGNTTPVSASSGKLDEDGTVSAQYRITAIPTNFFVNREGTIDKITYEITESGAEAFIKELLDDNENDES